MELWRAFMATDGNHMDLWTQVNTVKSVSLLRDINADVELEAILSTGVQLCSY